MRGVRQPDPNMHATLTAGMSPHLALFDMAPRSTSPTFILSNSFVMLATPAIISNHPIPIMCDYMQVEFRCGHVRYTVRTRCTNYERIHKHCAAKFITIQLRYVK
jgi:hypothetical protein